VSPSTQDTPPEGGRGQGNASRELVAVSVHGERVGTPDELEQLPVERIAEVMLELDEVGKRMRETRALLDAELARRLDVRGRDKLVIGEYELHRKSRNTSEWDADELELVLRRLVDEGVVDASELVGVITHETVVGKRRAQQVVDRLAERERRLVEQCRTWKRSVSGVEVVRAIPLLPEQSEGA
jgi:hypothetical protein